MQVFTINLRTVLIIVFRILVRCTRSKAFSVNLTLKISFCKVKFPSDE